MTAAWKRNAPPLRPADLGGDTGQRPAGVVLAQELRLCLEQVVDRHLPRRENIRQPLPRTLYRPSAAEATCPTLEKYARNAQTFCKHRIKIHS